MKEDLEIYLNDHLAGAAGGLSLVTHLAETATEAMERSFFEDLKRTISRDRDTLMQIIQELGFSAGVVRQAVGSASTRAGIWRMEIHGMNIGELGRFEMIELLAVGIHGKCLLWKTLTLLAMLRPEWKSMDFQSLVRSAEDQSQQIEEYRSREAMMLFSSADR
ncbi:hypothetical protein ACFQY0_02175 [Haloferula chungangensis]|uniref:Uncharacterized protein n=1 Tax=Haloferula chungangensis TaxID=1048331 RepID=A0ABW2L0V5_9BACT